MISICSMYRKEDWLKAGGYCEEILGREDWDFWISMFKTGGTFKRLPFIGLYYRLHANFKRKKIKKRNNILIQANNQHHTPSIYEQINASLLY